MPLQPLAYLYPEFLESQEARPIRILAEYLEPLARLKAQKIQDTVVFFGSARVDSRERAERALRTLRARGVRNADAEYEAELTKTRKALEWAGYDQDGRRLRALRRLRARGFRNADAEYEAELTKTRKALEWARYYEDARELARMLTAWS